MDESNFKALKNYLIPKKIAAGLLPLGAVFLVFAVIGGHSYAGLAAIFGLPGIIMIACGGYFIGAYKKLIWDIESRGEVNSILRDFNDGRRAFDDNLIIGEKWLIGKGYGCAVRYGDIKSVRQNISKYKGHENRTLTAVYKNDTAHVLCRLKSGGKSDAEFEQAESEIGKRISNS